MNAKYKSMKYEDAKSYLAENPGRGVWSVEKLSKNSFYKDADDPICFCATKKEALMAGKDARLFDFDKTRHVISIEKYDESYFQD